MPKDLNTLGNEIVLGSKYKHSFSVDYTDGLGEQYTGDFVVHRPNIGERIEISVIEAQLKQNYNVDIIGTNLAMMVAALSKAVDSAPHWFENPATLYDIELIRTIHDKYVGWVNSFFRRDEKPGESNSDSSSSDDAVATPTTAG